MCVFCDPGMINAAGDDASGGDTSCDPLLCAAEQYVADHECETCPPGTLNGAGDDASSDDTECDPILCDEDEHVVSNACESCAPGSLNDSGDDASGGDTECDPILCSVDEHVFSHVCEPCELGMERAAGDDASGDDTSCTVTLCQPDERVENHACVACDGGTYNGPGDRATGDDTVCDCDLFWVGGTGSWSDTAHWATTPGGAGGAAVPTDNDKVCFAASSFPVTGQTLTLDVDADVRGLDWRGVANRPAVVVEALQHMNVYGSVSLPSGDRLNGLSSLIWWHFLATGDATVDAPIDLGNTYFEGGGTYTLLSDLRVDVNSKLFVSAGTFDANGHDVATGAFASTGSEERTVRMGTGEWRTSCQDDVIWEVEGSNVAIDAGSSTLHIAKRTGLDGEFWGGGAHYATVILHDTQYIDPLSITVRDSNTYDVLVREEISEPTGVLYFSAGTVQTVGTLVFDGEGNLITLRSDTPGTQFTLDAETADVAYVDVEDAEATGEAAPFDCSTGCIDSGNNDGWTFP